MQHIVACTWSHKTKKEGRGNFLVIPPFQWQILALVHAENLKRNFQSTILCKINEICICNVAGVDCFGALLKTFCRWRWHHKWPLYCLAASRWLATCASCHLHLLHREFCGFNIQSHFGLIFLLSFGFGVETFICCLADNRLLLSLHFNVWSWQHQNSGKRSQAVGGKCQEAIATIWCQVAFENALNPLVCRFVYLCNTKLGVAWTSCIPHLHHAQVHPSIGLLRTIEDQYNSVLGHPEKYTNLYEWGMQHSSQVF